MHVADILSKLSTFPVRLKLHVAIALWLSCHSSHLIADTTNINFFALSTVDKSLAASLIDESISTSNTILINSGIALIRQVGSIEYPKSLTSIQYDRLDLVMTQVLIYDRKLYDRLVANNQVSVLILDSNRRPGRPCGSTHPNNYPTVAVIDINCDSATLEHELGHLYGAQHESKFANDLLPYAYAAICDNFMTIMSSNSIEHRDKTILMTYSHPDLKVNGIQCGDRSTNNRKVILENIHFFQ
ncbi:Reprolysin-like metallo-peptidase family M12B [Vibrio crassostreae]|nr:hypothetical protein EDB37_100524 [Vibrio crassostreae]CAK2439903.1 Reprolysin-like metallo-peptidase family M12B [Vibrio crassostreae]CAK2549669.1 Reprolysin-like metallo-peptidase family M12B [Vibrio crassostreae]CAK3703264.1 Reprolysin-like metallo-peptidase family M12B [Vibrio crassostreae]CAK3992285.1 Reprolysin-like metallo-peptidase family M12B [Vibrio crassostreae]